MSNLGAEKPSQKPKLSIALPILIFLVFSAWLFWWTSNNPLSDGYQNEYLHLGNAFDIFEALLQLDFWHLRWYTYTSYWAWGFYLPPWIGMFFTGKSLSMAILSNLWYLGLLIWSMEHLDRHFGLKYSLLLLLFCPAVFGAMTRFEPNFANIAFMAFGLLTVIRSQQFADRRWSLLWGVALGLGLMMDRLTLGFFLIPAILPIIWQKKFWASKSQKWNLLLGIGVTLLLTFAYYREFFFRHSGELLSQAPVGEIDSAGSLILQDNPIPWLYYPLSLLDIQAGIVIGSLMLLGAFYSWKRKASIEMQILQFSIVPALIFFTIVAKKQPYYLMPALVPLAIFASYFRRTSLLAIGFGVLSWLSLGWGMFEMPRSVFPETWTSPKYVLAKPPSSLDWDLSTLVQRMDQDATEVIVFSEDQTFFEGFVVLEIREALDAHVRGITQDPIGVWEFKEQAQYVLWVTQSENYWPSKGRIETELIADHYKLAELPALAEGIVEMKGDFRLVEELRKEGRRVLLFQRVE